MEERFSPIEGSAAPGESETILIVGAGIAGVRCAFGLRESGFKGTLRLLDAEPHPPYDRPPLSKAVLAGEQTIEQIYLDPRKELESGDVEVRSNARCVKIDRTARLLELASGEIMSWSRLVLATGSRVRTLPELPEGMPHVHYLRTLDHAMRLRRTFRAGITVAVVGAGVIGLEVAASLVALGATVTVVDPAPRVMGRSACPELGDLLLSRHERAGVRFNLETTIERVEHVGDRIALTLSNGTDLMADEVVVGVGVLPAVELAVDCGLTVDRLGVVTDGRGQTSDPAIYAAGEVAYHINSLFGRHDRQETWAHAAAHGTHVGHALMGRQGDYAERASYWTDQYDLAVQVIGLPSGDTNVVRGNLASEGGMVFHLVEGVIAGITSVNAARQLRAARKLLGQRGEPATLRDPCFDIKQLI